MKITDIKSQWVEEKGFSADHPDAGNAYIFLHFCSPAVLHTDYCDICVQPGACILFDKHVHHRYSAPNNALTFDWFHLHGDLTLLAEKYEIRFNQLYYPTNCFAVTQIVRNLEREFSAPDAFSDDYCTTKITELFITMSRNTIQPAKQVTDTKTCLLFEEARKEILSRYAEDWTTERMANLTQTSYSAFTHIYKQLFGIAPKQDLLACRIQHAKFLLLTKKYSVKQVAGMCGYKNASHFARQFKACTGATPGKFICL